MTVRVLVPSGVLGLGFDQDALEAGLKLKPDVICIDGGSTDSGPHSLGTSTSKYSRAACKSEWRILMQARDQLNIPLIIGSAGTCGTDAMVDWMLQITIELASELGQHPQVALVYSEQTTDSVARAFKQNNVSGLEPAIPINAETIGECEHIVALAGAEQIQAALNTGADIIIAGRTTDTAVISALPLLHGCDAGASWHAAKIAECGALCSTHPTSGVIVVDIDQSESTDGAVKDSAKTSEVHPTGFTIYPTASGARCTPHSVSAHMLYENANPFILYEPGGHLNVSDSIYTAQDQTRVRVCGSRWIPTDPYTVKLEGARLAGYQCVAMCLLRDPRYVQNAEKWIDKLSVFIDLELQTQMDLDQQDYDIDYRLIGKNAVLGKLESKNTSPDEIGVLVIITAETQETADEIGKFMNPFLLHYPLTDNESLPTFAFPFSPAQMSRGPLYEFCLNHVMQLEEPMSAFRIVTHQLTA
ncbi:MAG: DUF1446 domain-containing protein [Granulosicoccus sp.]|nr:DUF1446 domain-containing protein [Granulosicoccus sp.]